MVDSINRKAMSKFWMLFIIFFILSQSACQSSAQPLQYEKTPALWTIDDDDTTLHILGYAPVLPKGTVWNNEDINMHIDASNLIIIESDNSSQDAQALIQTLIPDIGLYKDSQTLSAQLSQEEQDELNEVTTQLGAPLAALEALRPWLASIQVGVLAISKQEFDLVNTPVMQITDRAKTTGKPINYLETPDHLMRIMASFSDREQKDLFLHAVRSIRDNPQQQSKLSQAWLSGDIEQISETLHGENGSWSSPQIYQTLLIERNKNWTQKIKDLMKDQTGSIFMAVGLGHLAGPDSLIKMLESEGMKVKRQNQIN